MRFYLAMLWLLLLVGFKCNQKQNSCGTDIARVEINVEADASGFDVVKYNKCNEAVETVRHVGRDFKPQLDQYMKDVDKSTPIKINVKQ